MKVFVVKSAGNRTRPWRRPAKSENGVCFNVLSSSQNHMCNCVLIFVRNRDKVRRARAAAVRIDARRRVASKRQRRTTHGVLLHIHVGKSKPPLPANRFVHRFLHRPTRRGEACCCAARRRCAHHCYFALVKRSSHEFFAISIQKPFDASHAHQVASHAQNRTTKTNIIRHR